MEEREQGRDSAAGGTRGGSGSPPDSGELRKPQPQEPEPAHPRRRRSTLLKVFGAVTALAVIAMVVLWQRCGIRGCPDVDMLKGFMPDEASVLMDREGEEIGKLYVTRRVVVPVDSMPEHLLNAFVAIEDRRFWSHGGVDWRRVGGALLQNVRARGVEEGSSTITMQLARNVFPDKLPANERTIWRKLGEARVARQIEGRYSKREIIELYLNQIYFGSGAYGIQSAAEEYFGKDAHELTLAEAALLAALPRAPSRLNPRANREAALEGRDLVLRRMADQGLITEAERAEASEARLVIRERRTRTSDPAPYFVESVRRQLEDQLGSALYTEGYRIHTTLDLRAQRAAEQELERQLAAMESGRFGSFPHRTYAGVHADTVASSREGTPYLQGAVVMMDARTGDVLALVGGRDYNDSEFNRATQAMRQPGSAFKPFVYAAAVASGYPPTHVLMDQPLRVNIGRQVWEPRNYDGSFSGAVTLRQALTQSKNVPTVRLANDVGIRRVTGLAEEFGLGRIPTHPSVVLGTAEVTPLNLTAAYAAFATLGQRPEPRFVTRVVDRHGRVVWQQAPRGHRVIDPAAAFIVTSIMQDVVDRGTGTGVRAAGFSAPAAGKTGTTQDAADVWFVGFTPEIVTTVWVGLDRRRRILRGATGGQIVAPVWGRIMRQVASGGSGWSPPPGVDRYTVDERGVVADAGCSPEGATRTEYFLRGTAPVATCYPPGYYAYSDSMGYDDLRYEDDAGWWDRLRRRFAREDSLRIATEQGITEPADEFPAEELQPPEEVPPADTATRPIGRPAPGAPTPPQPQPQPTPPSPTQPSPTQPSPPPPQTRPQQERQEEEAPRPPPRPIGDPVRPPPF